MKREDDALFQAALLKEGVAGGFRKKKLLSRFRCETDLISSLSGEGSLRVFKDPHTNMSAVHR